jgi:uncharacterized membrane protein
VEGAINSGSVTFQPVTTATTRMLVEISYEPQGLLEDLGAVLGIVERKLERELAKFKAFLEASSCETGAWRSRIKGDPMQP